MSDDGNTRWTVRPMTPEEELREGEVEDWTPRITTEPSSLSAEDIIDAFTSNDPECTSCGGEGHVCENHPGRRWPDVCECGAGMPCPQCCTSPPEHDESPVGDMTVCVPCARGDHERHVSGVCECPAHPERDERATGPREAEIWVSRRRQGGQPCVMGTRIPTAAVAHYVAATGSVEKAIEAYPALTPETIEAAVWFEETFTERADERRRAGEREAALVAIAESAIAAIGAGGHSHWRSGGSGGTCLACVYAREARKQHDSDLRAALAADEPEAAEGGAEHGLECRQFADGHWECPAPHTPPGHDESPEAGAREEA